MHGPMTSGWLLMALCAATGLYCLVRMRRCTGEAREAAGGEALMGFGMAAMAVPAALLTLPSWHWVVYAVVFGAAALRAISAMRTHRHHVHHLVGCLAMIHMAAAMAGSGGAHVSHGSTGTPALTAALFVYFAGYVLRTGLRLAPVPAPAGAPGTPAPARGSGPELALACRISMGLAMLAMLLTL
ncbi:DUF5134 domain-containing protein [Streptomyces sp. ISL-10]|uniref:DUF5134 domain-containing protein n=1 Tax=Streptomyces sp. ISL-10 TaxID=2819172 RepID=UPI001BEBD650|nr:DUF5134 domain-containing protein [Streptomyces sp. ISL-10]MBT2368157.1 DUF5134 domain-containing protein [Streptomyces sp. ISL-10]